jgi:putative sigma-54 modulation protein
MGKKPAAIAKKDSNSLLDFPGKKADVLTMKLILSTHNVTLTKAIEDHVLSRLEKLENLDRFAISARITLEHDNLRAPDRQFGCSMRISVPGPDLFAEDAENDLYAAIDLVTKKIEQQIRKRHSKFKARNHTVAARSKRTRQEANL